jgi:hypothetical protein
MHAIFLGEAFDQIPLVQRDALREIARHADVERAIATARENVNTGIPGAIGHGATAIERSGGALSRASASKRKR